MSGRSSGTASLRQILSRGLCRGAPRQVLSTARCLLEPLGPYVESARHLADLSTGLESRVETIVMESAKRVVAIPGEDAAAEAFAATLSLLDGLSLDIDWTYPPVGAGAIQTHGEPFPAEAIAAIDDSDAALFGATSGASARALFYLRWGRETFANVRPTRFTEGFGTPLARPEGIDLVIVRENLEDLYVVSEGAVEDLAPLRLGRK